MSARDGIKTGALAPTITWHNRKLAKYVVPFANIFPDSISGQTKISACPATGDSIPLIFAASRLTALSNARGPSMTQPLICPLSYIFVMIAASFVEDRPRITVSTAESSATFGFSLPRA